MIDIKIMKMVLKKQKRNKNLKQIKVKKKKAAKFKQYRENNLVTKYNIMNK